MRENGLRRWLAVGALFTFLVGPSAVLAEEEDDDLLGLELVPLAPVGGNDDEEAAEGEDEAAEAAPEEDADAHADPEPVPAQPTRVWPPPASGPPLPEHPARVRFTAEPGLGRPAAGHARVGLFGIDLDVRPGDGFFVVGAGGFGAATGNLGGFFGGGVSGGLRMGVAGPVSLEAGAMVGAGGGAGARTGSGLFVRPRAGLHVDLTGYGGHVEGAGVHISHLYFPGGEFASTHLALSFELAAPAPLSPGLFRGEAPAPDRHYGASVRSFRLTTHGYFLLPERSVNRRGEALSSPRSMVGLEFREFFTRHGFGLVEARALATGGQAGFAELTVGGGFAVPLDAAERFSFFGSGGIGGAGGGGIVTGGGLYLRGALGLDVDLPGPFSLGVDAGIQDAIRRGRFTAVSAGLRLGITQEVVRPRAYAVRSLVEDDALVLVGWRVRAAHATWFEVPGRGDAVHVVQLLGLKLDHMVGEIVYLTGQGAAAWAGLDGAALSVGTVGVGALSPEWNRIRLSGEARVGAAGGGGVGAGSGLVVQPMGGIHVAVTDALGIDVMGGWLLAPTGTLSTPAVDVGLVYAFSTPRLSR